MFLATTLVPLVCLGWLGWQVAEEDRRQQEVRVQEQRGQTAELAVSALSTLFAETEERLATFDAAPDAVAAEASAGTIEVSILESFLPTAPVRTK